jgi:signal transduction histidine kinase
LVVGVSTKHNQLALGYLKTGLMIIFPLSIVMIFISARLIAGQSTKPVFSIIKTAKKITENNLSERIILPKNKDELYLLSITINSLVERLETQLQKAKQFSADASHELRTPLAVVKGTLEILIRKKRTIEEYNEKINYTLKQVERLERLVEQFLVLSRVENNSLELKPSTFEVKNEVLKSIERFQVFLEEKQISVFTSDICTHSTENFKELFEIIIDNILSNAIKYSNLKGKITVSSFIKNNMYFLSFQDNGIGIDEKELQMIQNRFYRINTNSSPDHTGTGLGLNIATQLANISGIQLKIESQKKIGTIIFISLKLK